MRLRRLLLPSVTALALLPAAAAAAPHTVVPGETLSGIAAANGVSTSALAAANGLAPDAFVIAGTTLQVPAPGTATTASAPAPATPAPLGGYRVRTGDSLGAIAAEHGVSVAELAAANGLDPNGTLLTGASLRLPAPGSAPQQSAPASGPAGGGGGGHLVIPGETLTGIAAANGITPSALAAANGLRPDSFVIAGTHLTIPAATGSAAPAGTTPTTSGTTGGHLVVPGETLSGIAAANGITPSALAAANGLRPDSFVIAGTRLKIPAATGTAAPAATPVAAPAATATGPVAQGGGRLDAGTIQSIAAQNGVPGSLAAAIAWQESGFNNNMVSVADARGIMQVIPSSWEFVQKELGAGPLNPSSPTDNVKAGSVLLNHLLQQTGGDEATAIAAYYQGLGSVREIGMLPETQKYVANVQALKSRFGG
ncbi:MAG: LysM peptidoglycan-binding domain-containing protein [Solirubrobacterales bacterium]|nr:LysM peptidoglycan-binding domain-containing protein [Solirubrobacterales bacterium]